MSESGASFGGKAKTKLQNPGGTPGGLGEVLSGLAMMAVGIYIVFDHVTVRTSLWRFFRSPATTFGITLLPPLIGGGLAFFDGGATPPWVASARRPPGVLARPSVQPHNFP